MKRRFFRLFKDMEVDIYTKKHEISFLSGLNQILRRGIGRVVRVVHDIDHAESQPYQAHQLRQAATHRCAVQTTTIHSK